MKRHGIALAITTLLTSLVINTIRATEPLRATSNMALTVDVASGRHPISPYIYGMNFADEVLAAELRLPVRRWGGNSTTRYNWQNNTTNIASDWYFENIVQDSASSADAFVDQDQRTGTRSLITIPTIGWLAKNSSASHPFACGFSVSKYGVQQSTDPWDSNCGNGRYPNGSAITANDPHDTSIAITATFAQNWVDHMTSRYGQAAVGGVMFYDLDNEPMLWHDTHRDVHPLPLGYDELLSRTLQYAAALKIADGSAQILGPAEWGWTNYFYSALDEAPGGAWWANPLDRNAHGGMPLVAWYLQQLHLDELARGSRLLDYLDLHYYPQANGVALTNNVDPATRALRLRSTRSLWDPTYVDESWINGTEGGPAVRLIPRMHYWVNTYYPGTKIAISEYNWGALDDMNGALTQADVLGIFGREGLDLAALWGPPSSDQPGAFAFRMFRNYDGASGDFGEIGVQATSSDQGQLAIYAAQHARDLSLNVMVINKTDTALSGTITLMDFPAASPGRVYRYSGANLSMIVHEPDQPVDGNGFSTSFPAASITLFTIPYNTATLTKHAFVSVALR